MDHQPPADSSIMHAPTLPRRGVPVDAGVGRFSPLTAPQREAIDAFCRDSRSWALRQARRSYRHLPESLREQAVERAFTELRTRTPASLERRALAAELADRLTESLRHVHVGWCLNESSALLRREGTEPVQPEVRREELAHFVDDGLGGLERAVLQLEIGAGRDTRTSRAALRLQPRQYAQHREAGLSKLRDAISAQVIGRACDQHVGSVVDAALGDRGAMDTLASGTSRCRYCAREAQGLRSVLHERLAVAPWPIAIKPAGLLAAKLGVLGAIVSGKGAGAGAGAGALAASSSSGASVAATVLAVAALATGSAAVLGHDATPREQGAAHEASVTNALSKPAAGTARRTVAAGSTAAKAKTSHKSSRRTVARHHRAAHHNRQSSSGSAPTTSSTSTATSASASAPSAGSGASAASGAVTTAAKPITDAAQQTASKVTSKLPPVAAAPVQKTVDNVTSTVDDATKAVDKLLP
jgi:hypothetical protein